MKPYSVLARHYDDFTENVEYKKRTDFILDIMTKSGHTPHDLLDLACGTGGFAIELADRGCDVTGVDISEDMLSAAQTAMYKRGVNILLLKQDMRKLDLYGTVDTAICMLDGINHLLSENDVKQAFERVSLFLEPGGLFVFDVNTPFKHREILSADCFVYENADAVCVWSNSECSADGIVDMTIDIFERENSGLYSRRSEQFSERAYDIERLTSMLGQAGLRTEGIFGDMKANSPAPDEERVYIVCRKG